MILAAIGTGETPPATYQGDFILLEAIVQHGKISYEDGDVLQREAGWRPTARQETAVENDLKSYPVHMVTFYRTGDGSVSYKYDKVKPSAPTADRGCCSKFRACCPWVWSSMVACWERMAACWRCMVAFWERMVACWRCMVAFWERMVACCRNVVHCFGNIWRWFRGR